MGSHGGQEDSMQDLTGPCPRHGFCSESGSHRGFEQRNELSRLVGKALFQFCAASGLEQEWFVFSPSPVCSRDYPLAGFP